MCVFLGFCGAVFAAETVWIEGEHAVLSTLNQHSWYSDVNRDLLSPGVPGAGEGEWLAHFANNSDPVEAEWALSIEEGGEYELWVRAGSYRVAAWIQLDDAEKIDLDLDATARETLNLSLPAVDVRFLSWTHVRRFELEPGEHLLRFGLEPHPAWGGSQIYGGVDAIVVTNSGRAPSGASMPSDVAAGPSDWFAFYPGDPPRDWTRSELAWTTVDATERVVEEEDRLALLDDSTVKFWGVNARPPGSDALMDQQAAMLGALGVNLVRVHPLQALIGNPVDEDALDQFDRWFSALKTRGVNMQWSVFYPHTLSEGDGYALYSELSGGSTSGLVTVFEELQAYEWAYLEALLNHQNPYTESCLRKNNSC